jgi:hypothetical protein
MNHERTSVDRSGTARRLSFVFLCALMLTSCRTYCGRSHLHEPECYFERGARTSYNVDHNYPKGDPHSVRE